MCREPSADQFASQMDAGATTPVGRQELSVVEGAAGGSATAEFKRRHDARQERVQTKFPRMGKFLLAVFDDPPSTTAWAKGAAGEEKFAQKLAEIAGPLLRVLHDRRIPGTRANIDHLVICPTGVYVVDAKRYRNARPALRVEGGWIRPRQELLTINGRDSTKLVEGVHKQVALVRAALADQPDVLIHGVLCFIDADWPLLGGTFKVQGVEVLCGGKLRDKLINVGPLDAERIAELQWLLHQAFPRS